MRKPVNRRRRGNAMVESALILSTFLFLLIGVLDLAQVLYIHQTLGERVRNVTRSAAIAEYSDDTIRNLLMYNQATAPEGVTSSAFNLAASNIVITRQDLESAEQRLTVRVQNLNYNLYSPLVFRTLKNIPIVGVATIETED